MVSICGMVEMMMLSLRRRYLERQIDQPFDAAVSRELDAVIVEQERLTERDDDRFAIE